MNDSMAVISQLKEIVTHFVEERDWDQFHTAKDLAIGLSTEANELLALFRFKDNNEQEAIMSKPSSRQNVMDELSDVLFFILRFSHKYNIDLATSLIQKIQRNSEKYPIAEYRGSNRKYDES